MRGEREKGAAPSSCSSFRMIADGARTCRALLPILIPDLPVSTLLLRWRCSALLVASRPLSLRGLKSADMMLEGLRRRSKVMHVYVWHTISC